MITPANINGGFMTLFNYWVQNFKRGPDHIYYFRDGVSEGQYNHVLDQEVKNMKDAIVAAYGDKAASVSVPIFTSPISANLPSDEVDCHCLQQATSHPILPQGW
jgi:hypothetical protein